MRVCWESLAEPYVSAVFNSCLWETFSQILTEVENFESEWTMSSTSIVNAVACNCGQKVSIPEHSGGNQK